MAANLGWKYDKDYFEGEYRNENKYSTKNSYFTSVKLESYSSIYQFAYSKDMLNLKDDFSLTIAYPGLMTGTGIAHGIKGRDNVFKLGFYFDYTTGMPVLPGSSIKGLLRSYFPSSYKDKYPDEYEFRVKYITALVNAINTKLSEFSIEQEIDNFLKDKIAAIEREVIVQKENIRQNLESEIEALLENVTPENELALLQRMENLDNEIEEKIKILILKKKESAIRQKDLENLNKQLNNRKKRELQNWKKTLKEMVFQEIDPSAELNVEFLEKEIFEGKKFIKLDDQNWPVYKAISTYHRDIFHDAALSGNGLFLDTDYITPHKDQFQEPNPIMFLKIRPDIQIRFFFDLKDSVNGLLSKEGKLILFETILSTFGIGAKTNVGYGQFSKVK